jgi:hypothetical protein
MFNRTPVRAAAAVAIATLALAVPAVSAEAAGPTQVCYSDVAVSNTLGPNQSVSASWAEDGHYELNGIMNQNGNKELSPYIDSWSVASSEFNYITLGGRNAGTSTVAVSGWLVLSWVC